MSGPRRSGRHKKKDVQLVVSCVRPNPDEKVDHKTSFYEIDIQSNFDCPSHGTGRRKRKAPAGAAVKGASKDSGTRTRQKAEDDGAAENPLAGERYPKIGSIVYEEHGSSAAQSASFKVETQLVADGEKKKERKNSANKKRMWTAEESQRKYDKHVKSYVIEHYGERRTEVETVVQKYEEDSEGNEVHLHHHEHHHHHHYYADGKPVRTESGAPPLFFEENFGASPEIVYPAMTAPNKEERAPETDESCLLLVGPPPPVAEEASEETKELPAEPPERPATRGPSKKFRSGRPSRAPIDEASPKDVRSGFPTDETAGGSDHEDPVVSDNLEIHGLRVERNKSPKTCSSLIESVKNVSHIMSPIVLTDHKTVPKFWYIRCKCRPWSKEGKSEEVGDVSPRNSREEANATGTATEIGEAEKATDTGENSISSLSEIEEHQVDFTKEFEFEVWLEKVREELCEIKHRLKRIELNRLLSGGSATPPFRNEKPLGDSNQITVYSSRTFIVQPSDDAVVDV